MLWFKGWLETRLRALFGIGMCLFFILLVNRHATPPAATGQRALGTFAFVWAILPSMTGLAGAGVRTQPAFQAIKGQHGSMYFTLSLPVSRMRILATRAMLGWIETTALIAFVCGTAWAVVPGLRTNVPVAGVAAYFLTVSGCVSGFYFLSVLFATFLDAQWLPFAGMISVAALAWCQNSRRCPS
jgi:ABC-2 type transport system permease protein